MASKLEFIAVDKLLKDLLNADKLFGNLIVIVSGDFRSILPIVRYGNRTQIRNNTVKRSNLWGYFNEISLIMKFIVWNMLTISSDDCFC